MATQTAYLECNNLFKLLNVSTSTTCNCAIHSIPYTFLPSNQNTGQPIKLLNYRKSVLHNELCLDLLESICKHVHHVSFDKGVIFEPLFKKSLPKYFQQIIERN